MGAIAPDGTEIRERVWCGSFDNEEFQKELPEEMLGTAFINVLKTKKGVFIIEWLGFQAPVYLAVFLCKYNYFGIHAFGNKTGISIVSSQLSRNIKPRDQKALSWDTGVGVEADENGKQTTGSQTDIVITVITESGEEVSSEWLELHFTGEGLVVDHYEQDEDELVVKKTCCVFFDDITRRLGLEIVEEGDYSSAFSEHAR